MKVQNIDQGKVESSNLTELKMLVIKMHSELRGGVDEFSENLKR